MTSPFNYMDRYEGNLRRDSRDRTATAEEILDGLGTFLGKRLRKGRENT